MTMRLLLDAGTDDGAGLAPASAPAGATPLTIRVDFTASSFGGGPNRSGGSPGAPVQALRGSVTIRYAPGRPSGARVTSLRIQVVPSSQSPAWRTRPTVRDVLLAIARRDGPPWRARPLVARLGAKPCGLRVCAGADDFSLAFELPANEPALGPLRFRGVHYAVTGNREVYQARFGTVTATRIR